MKLRVLFSIAAAVLVTSISFSVAHATQAKSIWDGVFTEEQAARGADAYKTHCSECHGGDLMGDGFAPSLAGADFQGNWNDLSVGDLFERIRISMPPSGPSSVSPAAKADITAYIFDQNKYPKGSTELEPKTEALKAIKIELKP
jgi:mono/diheme cytochrome c family protein